MSTLVAQTISNGTVSTSSANVIQGCAKAWVNFNGSTATIRASYNVSSITRVAAGNYTVTFTNAFADANYVVAGSAGGTSESYIFNKNSAAAQTASNFRAWVGVPLTSTVDDSQVHAAVFR